MLFRSYLAASGLSCSVWGATLRCGAWASHHSVFPRCSCRSLGTRASVVVVHGLSSCGLRALECRLSSCGAQLSCSAAHGIFRTRAQTRVPCVGRRILNHCATREVPIFSNSINLLTLLILSTFLCVLFLTYLMLNA